MEKIYIDAVLEKNLGDDLFIKILCDRYKDKYTFVSQTNIKYKKKYLPVNLKLYNGLYVKLINGFGSKILNIRKLFGKILKRKCNYMIGIGGSIFAEWGSINEIRKHFDIYDTKKDYYIIGCNFGPYRTDDFYLFIKNNVIKNAKDVCFRDIYSYNKFSDLKNTRHAADIVFGLDISRMKKQTPKRAVISVIDCNFRFNKEISSNYKNTIIQLVEELRNKGYEVNLMSFCKEENDEKAILSILKKIKNKEQITTYFYDGNIEGALDNINNSSIVIGSRFHANILGILLGKKVIPLAYSDKTINVLKDMDFKDTIFDIRDIEEFNMKNININEDIQFYDISDLMKDSINHFKEIDKIK